MPFTIKRGATRPSFAVQLREYIGTPNERPIDISDASGISSIDIVLSLATSSGPTVVKRQAVRMYPTIGKDSSEFALKGGMVRYNWVTDDTAVPGQYQVEFDLHWGLEIETIPNKGYFSVVVEADLG